MTPHPCILPLKYEPLCHPLPVEIIARQKSQIYNSYRGNHYQIKPINIGKDLPCDICDNSDMYIWMSRIYFSDFADICDIRDASLATPHTSTAESGATLHPFPQSLAPRNPASPSATAMRTPGRVAHAYPSLNTVRPLPDALPFANWPCNATRQGRMLRQKDSLKPTQPMIAAIEAKGAQNVCFPTCSDFEQETLVRAHLVFIASNVSRPRAPDIKPQAVLQIKLPRACRQGWSNTCVGKCKEARSRRTDVVLAIRV
jgi:hypothetical protein